MALTPLPPAPSILDPENFSAEADAFVAALGTLVTELNAIIGLTIPAGSAAASTLTGDTLAANVLESSLTSIGGLVPVTGVAGTNTITGGIPESNAAYTARALYVLIPANTNTGATTLNLTPSGAAALGARNVFWNGVACVGGELRAGIPVVLMDDGIQFHIIGNGANAPLTNPAYTDQTLTDGASVSWNVALGGIATLTLAGNRTMAAPTNLKKGVYILHVIQDATGSRTITWNAVFKWQSAVAPVLSTGANKRDIISFVCDGTNLYGSYMLDVR